MASHSTIVTIGVDRCSVNRNLFGVPCIVLNCLDKELVPFGERNILDCLENYPIEKKTTYSKPEH